MLNSHLEEMQMIKEREAWLTVREGEKLTDAEVDGSFDCCLWKTYSTRQLLHLINEM